MNSKNKETLSPTGRGGFQPPRIGAVRNSTYQTGERSFRFPNPPVWSVSLILKSTIVTNSLYRYGNYTYSAHQWFIENYRDNGKAVVLIEQEFKHRVMRESDDKEIIKKRNSDMLHTVTIPHTKSKRRGYRWKVNIESLDEAWYYIHAYTRINLSGIAEDPEPKASEYSNDFKVE